jgi:hypothetical protein
VFFPIPYQIKREEMALIARANSLLSGRRFRSRWSSPIHIELKLSDGAEFDLSRLMTSEGAALLIERDEEIEIAGTRIALGRIRTTMPSARAADPDKLRAQLSSGEKGSGARSGAWTGRHDHSSAYASRERKRQSAPAPAD